MMKRMKEKTTLYVVRMILVSLCLVGILFLDHSTSFKSNAYTQTTGKVTAASAKIRAEANTSSTALGSVVLNDSLTITDEVTGTDGLVWYQVFVDANVKGYIRSDLISKTGSSTTATTTPATTATTATTTTVPAATATVTAMDSKTAYVTTASVRVRSDASTTAAVLASVGKGVEVTVSGSAKGADGNTWYQVSFTYSGTTVKGFIRSDFLSFDALPEEEPAVTEVVGTATGSTTDTTGTETTAETTEEPAAGVTEAAATEEPTTEAAATEEPVSAIVLMNVEEEPVLPAGYEEISLNWSEETIRAWKNGDFYIFYAVTEKGNSSWVKYDSVEETYQRYIPDTAADGFFGSAKTQTIIIITLIVVVLLLIVLAALLYVKNKNLLSEIDWDDDEEEDSQEAVSAKAPKKSWRALNFMSSENEYEDDEDEDEDEDDEEEEPVIRKPQQSRPINKTMSQAENMNRQVARPVQGERPAQGNRPVQSDRPAQGRPVQGDRPVQGNRPVQGERSAQTNRPVTQQVTRPVTQQSDPVNGQRVVVRRPVSQENNGLVQNQAGQRVVVKRPVQRPDQNQRVRADEIDFIDIDALD